MKRHLVLFFLIYALADHSSSQVSAPVLKSFSTDKGCELVVQVRESANRNYTWTGECRDGKVWGRGVLTYENYDSYRKQYESRWAEVGQFDREGRQSGNWMLINRISKAIGFSPYQGGGRNGQRFLSQAGKPDSFAGAREYLDEWTSGHTDTMVPFLVVAAKAYFEDFANFYSGEFAKTMTSRNTDSASPVRPPTSSADDPKVLGRSARGG